MKPNGSPVTFPFTGTACLYLPSELHFPNICERWASGRKSRSSNINLGSPMSPTRKAENVSLDIQTPGEDRCLNPQSSPEKAFRGSKYQLTRYSKDFGCLGFCCQWTIYEWFPINFGWLGRLRPVFFWEQTYMKTLMCLYWGYPPPTNSEIIICQFLWKDYERPPISLHFPLLVGRGYPQCLYVSVWRPVIPTDVWCFFLHDFVFKPYTSSPGNYWMCRIFRTSCRSLKKTFRANLSRSS